MASLLPSIPLEFMVPTGKYPLINWLVEHGYPARISRQVLQEWGNSMFVTVYPSDYELLNNHFKVVKV